MTVSELDILEYLAYCGPASKYRIYKEMKPKRSYSTVHGRIKVLLKKGWVKEVRRGKAVTGAPKILYGLTLAGLDVTFYKGSPLLMHIDKIAEKHADLLPLVFGKWSHFKKMGLGETALERFRICLHRQIRPSEYHLNLKLILKLEIPRSSEKRRQQFITARFHDMFFCPSEFDAKEKRRNQELNHKWIEACMADEDLKAYTLRNLKEWKRMVEDRIMLRQFDLKFISDLLEKSKKEAA